MLRIVQRWLPERAIVVVIDSSNALKDVGSPVYSEVLELIGRVELLPRGFGETFGAVLHNHLAGAWTKGAPQLSSQQQLELVAAFAAVKFEPATTLLTRSCCKTSTPAASATGESCSLGSSPRY